MKDTLIKRTDSIGQRILTWLVAFALVVGLIPLGASFAGVEDAHALVLAPQAQSLSGVFAPNTIPTDWTGEYDGNHNYYTVVKRDLEIHLTKVNADGTVDGLATISPSSKASAALSANGTYKIAGTVDFSNGNIVLQGYEWIDYPVKFAHFNFLKLTGKIDAIDGSITGTTVSGAWQMKAVDYSSSAFKSSAFKRGVDSNQFAHKSSSFNDDRLVELDDDYFNALTNESSNSEKAKLKVTMWDRFESFFNSKWNGVCYGIAATMGLLYEGKIAPSQLSSKSKKKYYNMGSPGADSRFKNAIYYYYLTQYLEAYTPKAIASSWVAKSDAFAGLTNWNVSGDSQTVFLRNLVRYAASGKTGIFCFLYDGGGHAILVTGCKYNKNTKQYMVKMYDENSTPSFGKKGADSYLYVAKDYSSFTYTDANHQRNGKGPSIQTNDFKSMYLIDYDKMKALSASLSTQGLSTANVSVNALQSGRVEIEVPADADFTIRDAYSRTLISKGGSYSGSMPVYDVRPFISSEGSRLAFVVPSSSLFQVSGMSNNCAISVRNADNYQAFIGTNIASATFTPGSSLALQGSDVSFRAFVTTGETVGNNETRLVELSAKAKSGVTLTNAGNDVKISSGGLTDAKTSSYVNTLVYSKNIGTVQKDLTLQSKDFPKTMDINSCSVTLDKKKLAYTGKKIKPGVQVSVGGKILKRGTDYKVSYKKNVKASKNARVVIQGTGKYKGKKVVKFTIKKAKNTLVAKVKKKTFKATAKSGKKAAVLKKPIRTKSARGKVSFKNVSKRKALRQFKVNAKSGSVTIPQNTKAGLYSLKIRVTAKGTSNYKKAAVVKTVKIRVKR